MSRHLALVRWRGLEVPHMYHLRYDTFEECCQTQLTWELQMLDKIWNKRRSASLQYSIITICKLPGLSVHTGCRLMAKMCHPCDGNFSSTKSILETDLPRLLQRKGNAEDQITLVDENISVPDSLTLTSLHNIPILEISVLIFYL